MNLVNWQKKDYLIRIRRGWYCFNNKNSLVNINWLAANLIYKPSYISTFSALSYYNLIPEAVYDITSISTKRTNQFNTKIGNFTYNNIKKELYGFGHVLLDLNKDSDSGSGSYSLKNRKVLFADLEKAILDFFYINHQYDSMKAIELLRFDESVLSTLNMTKLYNYINRFESRVLEKRVDKMLKIYRPV